MRTLATSATVLAVASLLSGCGQATPPPPAQIGRYAIVQNQQVEHETLLLDTSTGKSYYLVEVTPKGPMAWVEMQTYVPPAAKPETTSDHDAVKDEIVRRWVAEHQKSPKP